MHDGNDFAPRRLLLAVGGAAVRRRIASQVASLSPQPAPADVLWLAEQAVAGWPTVAPGAIVQHLGGECRLLVVDLHQGFHPDAFAAAAGMLRGGGDCVVLAPPLDDWPAFDDPDRRRFAAYPHTTTDMRGLFLARLARLWTMHSAVTRINGDAPIDLRLAPAEKADGMVVPNRDQARVMDRVETVARGHARRPLVLTADRGRGKSTLLGICAARLLQAGLARITVVAPSRNAVRTLYRHARRVAGLAADDRVATELAIGGGRLAFRLPSEWRDADGTASSLVIVDEAAAIPVAQLERLLLAANRLVFASTVHGYEGSGRGFAVRFRASLDRLMPQWCAAHLDTPVRWAAGDPLEDLLNRSLLLDAEPPDMPASVPGEVVVRRVDVAALAGDEIGLRAVFALLVSAHYQTRPSDLRQLLDNPDVTLWLAYGGDAIVGVLLGVGEGGLDAAMASAIAAGRRRPRGHLLPQSLAVHAGIEGCLVRRVLRVQRIAVHPQWRRRGIGTRLLEAAAAHARLDGVDLLGCAYGVEPSLLSFWTRADFVPVRLGLRVDPASASRSLFMLRGAGMTGHGIAHAAARQFRADLPWALGGPLSDLDSGVAVALLAGRDCRDLAMAGHERRAIAGIAAGVRRPATAAAAVWKAVVHLAAAGTDADAGITALLAWQLQHRPRDAVCTTFRLDGRRALEALLHRRLTAFAASLDDDG